MTSSWVLCVLCFGFAPIAAWAAIRGRFAQCFNTPGERCPNHEADDLPRKILM
jgi:hypothetical protein